MTHEVTDIPPAQCTLSNMLVDKVVRNDLSLNTRVVLSVVPTNKLINDTMRKGKTSRVREFSRDIGPLTGVRESGPTYQCMRRERER